MLNNIVKQMLRKGFTQAAQAMTEKWTSLNLYEKKRAYYNWHFEWPSSALSAS